MRMIYPLVLCDGTGFRLQPMARNDQPAPFQPAADKISLSSFQATVQRHRGPQFHDPIIVTNHRHAELARRQLRAIQCGGQIIAEPTDRNTGPAVLAAAISILRSDPGALLLVLRADHIILEGINEAILRLAQVAAADRIVIFGVTPGTADCGCGYIVDGGVLDLAEGLHRVERFVEKPAQPAAQTLIDSGVAYWASGVCLFSAARIVYEFLRLEPALHATVLAAVSNACTTSDGILLEPVAFRKAPSVPIERAIFEHSAVVALAPLVVDWDDVGAWNAVYDLATKSADGNVKRGDVLTPGTTNSMIRANGRLVVVVGLEDVMVVDTMDALMVTKRGRSTVVAKVVEAPKSKDRAGEVGPLSEAKTWGTAENLISASGYKLEMLTVRPGSTAQINGHGLGASFLSVVTGEGAYLEDRVQPSHPLNIGTMLAIDKDTEVSLTNTQPTDLQALLLSTGQHRATAVLVNQA